MNTKIKKARKAAGLSQQSLAEILGVTNLTIHLWESGKVEMKTYQVVGVLAMIREYADNANGKIEWMKPPFNM